VKAGAEKLSGKALSFALHLRLMPLVIARIGEYDESCDLLNYLAILHCINEYMLADSFSVDDSVNLQSVLVEMFKTRNILLEKYGVIFKKITPKYHYLEHYPEQIIECGPFTAVWTARYESRHREKSWLLELQFFYLNFYIRNQSAFCNIFIRTTCCCCKSVTLKLTNFFLHIISELTTCVSVSKNVLITYATGNVKSVNL
jgi:hypothetical protein